MSEKRIHVEIVTPVHNRREITLRCLRSLERIDKTRLKVHVIVVNDGSTDGTGDAIRSQFPEVEVIEEDGSLWYTAGTNRGIEAALGKKPDYVLAINDDSVFDEKFLTYMVSCAEANSRSVVGSLILSWDQPHKVFQVAPRWSIRYGGWQHLNKQTVWSMPREAWEVDTIVGNCMLLPAAAIESVGLMDAKKFPHYGDGEYTARLRRAGWLLLIEPRARVFCQPNLALPTLRNQSLKTILKRLFFDERSVNNLSRIWKLNWKTSPTRFHGVMASAVFFARMGLRAVGLANRWPNDWPEDDLNLQIDAKRPDEPDRKINVPREVSN